MDSKPLGFYNLPKLVVRMCSEKGRCCFYVGKVRRIDTGPVAFKMRSGRFGHFRGAAEGSFLRSGCGCLGGRGDVGRTSAKVSLNNSSRTLGCSLVRGRWMSAWERGKLISRRSGL